MHPGAKPEGLIEGLFFHHTSDLICEPPIELERKPSLEEEIHETPNAS
jgi:hypothetical protein